MTFKIRNKILDILFIFRCKRFSIDLICTIFSQTYYCKTDIVPFAFHLFLNKKNDFLYINDRFFSTNLKMPEIAGNSNKKIKIVTIL